MCMCALASVWSSTRTWKIFHENLEISNERWKLNVRAFQAFLTWALLDAIGCILESLRIVLRASFFAGSVLAFEH